MTNSDAPSPTFLMLDADVLIKLAQHPANIEAIRAIARAVDRGLYRLVVPEPVLNAFNREKQNAADSYWNTQRTSIKKLRQLHEAFSISSEIIAFADRLSTELAAHASDVPKTIEATEALLAKGEPIPVTDKMKLSAADRVMQHSAPAKKARNSSINDCIIWEAAKERTSEGELIFVTDNYTDFSDPMQREKLHPELLSELGPARKCCYHSLEGFQKNHIKDVEIVVPSPASTICPICKNPIAPYTIPRPSQYGGWSYQLYCGNCHLYIDTGDPYDE